MIIAVQNLPTRVFFLREFHLIPIDIKFLLWLISEAIKTVLIKDCYMLAVSIKIKLRVNSFPQLDC